jgi:hypothetical protein
MYGSVTGEEMKIRLNGNRTTKALVQQQLHRFVRLPTISENSRLMGEYFLAHAINENWQKHLDIDDPASAIENIEYLWHRIIWNAGSDKDFAPEIQREFRADFCASFNYRNIPYYEASKPVELGELSEVQRFYLMLVAGVYNLSLAPLIREKRYSEIQPGGDAGSAVIEAIASLKRHLESHTLPGENSMQDRSEVMVLRYLTGTTSQDEALKDIAHYATCETA